jgi:Fic family protein
MPIVNGRNNDEVKYFDIFKYTSRIKLESYVVDHAEETNQAFDEYMKNLLKYDPYAVIFYLIDSFYKEIVNSQEIENHFIRPNLLSDDVFFDTLNVSHARIHQLHEEVTKGEENSQKGYRTVPVRVSKMTDQGEVVFWRAPNPEDVKPFMDDFVKLYKTTKASLLFSNPFIVSSLIHLLFIRIHPYNDGNGRTARMLHNIKFTESVNKIYGMKLKICPLNLSGSILINKPTYASRLDNIYFDIEHDTNDTINKWFDFILNMNDEQIFYNMNRIHELEESMERLTEYKGQDKQKFLEKINRMNIKNLEK